MKEFIAGLKAVRDQLVAKADKLKTMSARMSTLQSDIDTAMAKLDRMKTSKLSEKAK